MLSNPPGIDQRARMRAIYPTRAPEGFKRRHVIFWFTVLTAVAGAAAYLWMLTGYRPYDDEGALMITVKQYLSGMRIYDQVFSFYGPVYYLYQWVLHRITGTPVSEGSIARWKGLRNRTAALSAPLCAKVRGTCLPASFGSWWSSCISATGCGRAAATTVPGFSVNPVSESRWRGRSLRKGFKPWEAILKLR